MPNLRGSTWAKRSGRAKTSPSPPAAADESGLLKMLTIGLGNPAGAVVYHRAILDFGFDRIVRGAAAEVLARCPILAGVAVVENAYDQTARIEAVLPEQFEARESELLVLAKRWLPRLPFRHVAPKRNGVFGSVSCRSPPPPGNRDSHRPARAAV